MEYPDVAYFVAGFLLKHYPEALAERYALEVMPVDQLSLLDAIGRRRGCLAKGGVVDYDRTSRIFVNDLRTGALGPITFETPEMVARENAAQRASSAKNLERKQARKETRRAEYKAKRRSKQS